MLGQLNGENTICPICLETIPTETYLCSDDYLYDEKCFNKINLNKSPITRQKKSYFILVRKENNMLVYSEKEAKKEL